MGTVLGRRSLHASEGGYMNGDGGSDWGCGEWVLRQNGRKSEEIWG